MDPRQFQIDYGEPGRDESPYVGRTFSPSMMTAVDAVSEMAKLWYGRLIADPIRSMGNVGAGIIGNVPQINVTDATDLRRVGQQYVAPEGAGGVGDIMNALMFYGGPGIAAGKPGVASVGIFGGEKALGANLAMRDIAKKAIKLGKDPDEVWKATGWKPGMEGKMRFEIDDSKAMFFDSALPKSKNRIELADEYLREKHGFTDKFLLGNPKYSGYQKEALEWADDAIRFNYEGATVPLPNIIKHNDLFKQYPELKDVKVQIEQKGGGHAGSFNEHTNTITVGGGTINTDWRDTLTHEIQHWVQKKEGFARGGSPEMVGLQAGVYKPLPPEVYAAKNMVAWSQYGPEKMIEMINKNYDAETVVKAKSLLSELGPEGVKKYFKEKQSVNNYEVYRDLAGEIESRDAAARRTWDTDMRRAVPPETRKDAIIRWGDKGAEEIATELMK